MKIRDKMSIDDLEFNVAVFRGWGGDEGLETFNLFQICGIKRAVAHWVLMSSEERKKVESPLFYIFADVWARVEYEHVLLPFSSASLKTKEGDEFLGRKVDVWTMYVKPNEELLMDLVGRVSKNSAQKFLREERKRFKK